jgi:hypothetical protein
MKRLREVFLTGFVLYEMVRYDVLLAIGGFARVRRSLPAVRDQGTDDAECQRICDAFNWAVAFYWKPVLCLQSAVVTARLLRRRGFPAEVVIGCRPEPFFSHAWVELDGRVVNDSPGYRQQLAALARL